MTWSNDLGTQTWPRYGQDVTLYQRWSFYVNLFKTYSSNRQIGTHTDMTKNINCTAYAGRKNVDHIIKIIPYVCYIEFGPPAFKGVNQQQCNGLSIYSASVWILCLCATTAMGLGFIPISLYTSPFDWIDSSQYIFLQNSYQRMKRPYSSEGLNIMYIRLWIHRNQWNLQISLKSADSLWIEA